MAQKGYVYIDVLNKMRTEHTAHIDPTGDAFLRGWLAGWIDAVTTIKNHAEGNPVKEDE